MKCKPSAHGEKFELPAEIVRDATDPKFGQQHALQRVTDVLLHCLERKGVDTSVPRRVLGLVPSVTGQHCTSTVLRAINHDLLSFVRTASEDFGLVSGHVNAQIHALAAAIYYYIVVRVTCQHAVSAQVTVNGNIVENKEVKCVLDGVVLNLSGTAFGNTSWAAAIGLRYKPPNSDHVTFDLPALVRNYAGKGNEKDCLLRNMKNWRADCDLVVQSLVPEAQHGLVGAMLDCWAVGPGHAAYNAQANKAGTDKTGTDKAGNPKHAKMILQRASRDEHGHHNWYWVHEVCLKQLQFIDKTYRTDLAKRANDAWEGVNSLSEQSREQSRLHTNHHLYGRTYAFNVLFPENECPPGIDGMTICLHRCCTKMWAIFLATELVFTVVDMGFGGYLPVCSKSGVNHSMGASATAERSSAMLTARSSTEAMAQSAIALPDSQGGVMGEDNELSGPELSKAATLLTKAQKTILLATHYPFLRDLRRAIETHVLLAPRKGQAIKAPHEEKSLAPWWKPAELKSAGF